MAHDVFVSYSSKDKVVADAVVAALESRGVRCWVAPRDIPPGMDYGAAIIEGINASRVMVLIFSGNSNASPQVVREVERAVNKQLHIIPFRIERAEMSKAMEYYISSPHWLDAITPPLEGHIERLAASVRGVVEGPADGSRPARPDAPPPDASPPLAPSARRSLVMPIVIGLAVLVAAVAVFMAWRHAHRDAGRLAGSPQGATANPPAPAPTSGPAAGPVAIRSSAALLSLPAKDGLVRKFELGADDESGSTGRIFLSPDASRLVAGPFDNDDGYPTAAAWDTASGRPLFRVKGVRAVGVSNDVGKIFLATRFEGVGVRDVATGAKLCELGVEGQGVAGEWSHDGRMLAVAGGHKLGLFDPEGSEIRELASDVAAGYLWRMGFSPDDKALVLTGAFGSHVECRNPRSGVLLWTHDAAVPRAMTQFAAGASRLRISRDRTWVLDSRDGKSLMDLDLSWNDAILELSPDGAWLAATDRGADSGTIKLWSVDDKQEMSRFAGIKIAKPTALRFTPDGRRLLVGTAEGQVVVLDMATGTQVVEWKGGGGVQGIVLSDDGRFAATAGSDRNVVWLWRLPD